LDGPPPLDLKSLETRLKETNAVGFCTKVSPKNQVDDLLNEFRAFYQGQLKVTLAEFRPPYEMLLQKVLALLQDSDPPLAGAIVASREAILDVLSDPNKFAGIRRHLTFRQEKRREQINQRLDSNSLNGAFLKCSFVRRRRRSPSQRPDRRDRAHGIAMRTGGKRKEVKGKRSHRDLQGGQTLPGILERRGPGRRRETISSNSNWGLATVSS
jgi:hypothetical protein